LGDGNLQDVINQANSLKIPQENIHFVGKIMPDFLADYYQNADTFILNSHKETFGVVLAESLCCGCPIITTKNGGYSNEMSPDEGIVIPPNDSKALFEAMKKMIATKNHWNREKIAMEAHSKFGQAAIAAELDTIYQKIFNK
jgi:glycosyltransferase involved in cell wall biosynthesis